MNPSNVPATSMEARMAALKGRFIEDTLLQTSELERLAGRLAEPGDKAEVRQEIGQIAHRLAGRAGIFDFSALTPRASELEHFVLSHRSDADLRDLAETIVPEIRRVILGDEAGCHVPEGPSDGPRSDGS
ncbi:hypothetical protein LCGC14_0291290 [marine sediment metagenome]